MQTLIKTKVVVEQKQFSKDREVGQFIALETG